MYYVWFHAYQPGDEDCWVVISREEYDRLKPYEHDMRNGNFPYEDESEEEDEEGTVEGSSLGHLIFQTIMSRGDADLRRSEIDRIPSENIIEVALC